MKLNLVEINVEPFELTLPCGTEIELKVPNHNTMVEVMGVGRAMKDFSPDTLKSLNETVAKVLNHNNSSLCITKEYVAENFNLQTTLAFYKAYVSWATTVTQNPN